MTLDDQATIHTLVPVLFAGAAAVILAFASRYFKWPGSTTQTPLPAPPPDTSAHDRQAEEKGAAALRERETKEKELEEAHDDVILLDQEEREKKVPDLIKASDFLNDYLKKTGDEMRGKK